jgi:lipoprotein-anchoring transpeptidase ErfK/SrfK
MRIWMGIALGAAMTLASYSPAEASRIWDQATSQWLEYKPAATRPAAVRIPRQEVHFPAKYQPGTVVISTSQRRLYYVLPNGRAIAYGVGVGRDGFQWSGVHRISRKAEWPGWTPPPAMRKRQPGLPAYMPGGPANPLGARALYLGSSLYRIHGTNEASTIGEAVSSGCIRMLNDDVIDLYQRAKVGTKVVVLR